MSKISGSPDTPIILPKIAVDAEVPVPAPRAKVAPADGVDAPRASTDTTEAVRVAPTASATPQPDAFFADAAAAITPTPPDDIATKRWETQLKSSADAVALHPTDAAAQQKWMAAQAGFVAYVKNVDAYLDTLNPQDREFTAVRDKLGEMGATLDRVSGHGQAEVLRHRDAAIDALLREVDNPKNGIVSQLRAAGVSIADVEAYVLNQRATPAMAKALAQYEDNGDYPGRGIVRFALRLEAAAHTAAAGTLSGDAAAAETAKATAVDHRLAHFTHEAEGKHLTYAQRMSRSADAIAARHPTDAQVERQRRIANENFESVGTSAEERLRAREKQGATVPPKDLDRHLAGAARMGQAHVHIEAVKERWARQAYDYRQALAHYDAAHPPAIDPHSVFAQPSMLTVPPNMLVVPPSPPAPPAHASFAQADALLARAIAANPLLGDDTDFARAQREVPASERRTGAEAASFTHTDPTTDDTYNAATQSLFALAGKRLDQLGTHAKPEATELVEVQAQLDETAIELASTSAAHDLADARVDQLKSQEAQALTQKAILDKQWAGMRNNDTLDGFDENRAARDDNQKQIDALHAQIAGSGVGDAQHASLAKVGGADASSYLDTAHRLDKVVLAKVHGGLFVRSANSAARVYSAETRVLNDHVEAQETRRALAVTNATELRVTAQTDFTDRIAVLDNTARQRAVDKGELVTSDGTLITDHMQENPLSAAWRFFSGGELQHYVFTGADGVQGVDKSRLYTPEEIAQFKLLVGLRQPLLDQANALILKATTLDADAGASERKAKAAYESAKALADQANGSRTRGHDDLALDSVRTLTEVAKSGFILDGADATQVLLRGETVVETDLAASADLGRRSHRANALAVIGEGALTGKQVMDSAASTEVVHAGGLTRPSRDEMTDNGITLLSLADMTIASIDKETDRADATADERAARLAGDRYRSVVADWKAGLAQVAAMAESGDARVDPDYAKFGAFMDQYKRYVHDRVDQDISWFSNGAMYVVSGFEHIITFGWAGTHDMRAGFKENLDSNMDMAARGAALTRDIDHQGFRALASLAGTDWKRQYRLMSVLRDPSAGGAEHQYLAMTGGTDLAAAKAQVEAIHALVARDAHLQQFRQFAGSSDPRGLSAQYQDPRDGLSLYANDQRAVVNVYEMNMEILANGLESDPWTKGLSRAIDFSGMLLLGGGVGSLFRGGALLYAGLTAEAAVDAAVVGTDAVVVGGEVAADAANLAKGANYLRTFATGAGKAAFGLGMQKGAAYVAHDVLHLKPGSGAEWLFVNISGSLSIDMFSEAAGIAGRSASNWQELLIGKGASIGEVMINGAHAVWGHYKIGGSLLAVPWVAEKAGLSHETAGYVGDAFNVFVPAVMGVMGERVARKSAETYAGDLAMRVEIPAQADAAALREAIFQTVAQHQRDAVLAHKAPRTAEEIVTRGQTLAQALAQKGVPDTLVRQVIEAEALNNAEQLAGAFRAPHDSPEALQAALDAYYAKVEATLGQVMTKERAQAIAGARKADALTAAVKATDMKLASSPAKQKAFREAFGLRDLPPPAGEPRADVHGGIESASDFVQAVEAKHNERASRFVGGPPANRPPPERMTVNGVTHEVSRYAHERLYRRGGAEDARMVVVGEVGRELVAWDSARNDYVQLPRDAVGIDVHGTSAIAIAEGAQTAFTAKRAALAPPARATLDSLLKGTRSKEEHAMLIRELAVSGSLERTKKLSAFFKEAKLSPEMALQVSTADGLYQLFGNACALAAGDFMVANASPLDAIGMYLDLRATVARQSDGLAKAGEQREPRGDHREAVHALAPDAGRTSEGLSGAQIEENLNASLGQRLETSFEFHQPLPAQVVVDALWDNLGTEAYVPEGVLVMARMSGGAAHAMVVTRAEMVGNERVFTIRDPWSGASYERSETQLRASGDDFTLEGVATRTGRAPHLDEPSAPVMGAKLKGANVDTASALANVQDPTVRAQFAEYLAREANPSRLDFFTRALATGQWAGQVAHYLLSTYPELNPSTLDPQIYDFVVHQAGQGITGLPQHLFTGWEAVEFMRQWRMADSDAKRITLLAAAGHANRPFAGDMLMYLRDERDPQRLTYFATELAKPPPADRHAFNNLHTPGFVPPAPHNVVMVQLTPEQRGLQLRATAIKEPGLARELTQLALTEKDPAKVRLLNDAFDLGHAYGVAALKAIKAGTLSPADLTPEKLVAAFGEAGMKKVGVVTRLVDYFRGTVRLAPEQAGEALLALSRLPDTARAQTREQIAALPSDAHRAAYFTAVANRSGAMNEPHALSELAFIAHAKLEPKAMKQLGEALTLGRELGYVDIVEQLSRLPETARVAATERLAKARTPTQLAAFAKLAAIERQTSALRVTPLRASDAAQIMTRIDIPPRNVTGIEPWVPAANAAFYQRMGLAPTHTVTIGGRTMHLSRTYDLGDGRVGVVAYVEENGRVAVRSLYRSNSRGLWQSCPSFGHPVWRAQGIDGAETWFGKGLDSKYSTLLPIDMQEILTRQTRAEVQSLPPLTDAERAEAPNATAADRVFFGPLEYMSHHQDDSAYKVALATGDHGAKLTQSRRIGEHADPSSITISDPQARPDFSKPARRFELTLDSAIYPEPVQAYVYPSADGKLSYMFLSDGQTVWLGQVDVTAAPVNGFGVRMQAYDPGDLTIAPIEYVRMTPAGYAGAPIPGHASYNRVVGYHHKVPVLAEAARHILGKEMR